MAEDVFAERLARVRARFAGNLPGRIDSIDRALPNLSGDGESVFPALSAVHRNAHEICGIAPTVGFAATGKAARCVERILLQPLRDKRGLSEAEITSVREELAALRAAAQADAQSHGTASRSEDCM